MTRIGLISDTHHYLDDQVFKHFDNCDEIWHAGDFGEAGIAHTLQAFKPLRGVFGNIDGPDIRAVYPERLLWTCEDLQVFMIHIGGYPGKYSPGLRKDLSASRPGLFICGHSHILRIIFDDKLQCLHMNPGAAGKQGWHRTRTIVRFAINKNEIKDCEVIELGKR